MIEAIIIFSTIYPALSKSVQQLEQTVKGFALKNV